MRKTKTIDAIVKRRISRGALMIKLADADHNSSTMLEESTRKGETFWEQFKGGERGTLWVYRQRVRAFEKAGLGSCHLLGSLRRNVINLHRRP